MSDVNIQICRNARKLTEKEAVREQRQLYRKFSEKKLISIYQCGFCLFWHVEKGDKYE